MAETVVKFGLARFGAVRFCDYDRGLDVRAEVGEADLFGATLAALTDAFGSAELNAVDRYGAALRAAPDRFGGAEAGVADPFGAELDALVVR